MSKDNIVQEFPRIVLSADQIRKRIHEIARQISSDFQGKTLYVVCVLENGFMFMADLVRELEIPVVCKFLKPELKETDRHTTEIFFSPEVAVEGQHVLLVEALVQSGITHVTGKTGRSQDAALADMLKDKPIGRLITPEEVAAAVLFLCSPGASAITGTTLTVAGGEI